MSWSLDDLAKNGEKWDELSEGRMAKRFTKVIEAHDQAQAVLEGERKLSELDEYKEMGGIPTAEEFEKAYQNKFVDLGIEREAGSG